jgi:hypothetical protein
VTRWIAMLTLLLLAFTIVAPAVAPTAAYAATADGSTAGGLPNLPWAQIWAAIKTWGPILIYFIDAVVSAFTGSGDPSGTPNPPPPPPPPGNPSTDAPSLDGTAPIAWCGGFAAGACA